MPSYEEVVLSLEADGFTDIVDSALQLRTPHHDVRCALCGTKVEGPSIFFRTLAFPQNHHVCVNRVECRARAQKKAMTAKDEEQARVDELVAAVILPDEERFPENGD